jgi:hypothetical protein
LILTAVGAAEATVSATVTATAITTVTARYYKAIAVPFASLAVAVLLLLRSILPSHICMCLYTLICIDVNAVTSLLCLPQGKKLVHFDQHRRRSEPVTDALPIACALFNASRYAIARTHLLCLSTITQQLQHTTLSSHTQLKQVCSVYFSEDSFKLCCWSILIVQS